jgi:hypothetical protein
MILPHQVTGELHSIRVAPCFPKLGPILLNVVFYSNGVVFHGEEALNRYTCGARR